MNIQKLAAALVCLLGSGALLAHAVINETEAYAGEFAFITLRITHGCDSEASKEIRVKIPDGVTRVSPRFKYGWTAKKIMRKLDEPFKNEAGQVVNETVDEIVWTGGELPDGYYGEFQLRVLTPDIPDMTLWFKTIQNCDTSSIRWIEVPAAGQNPYELAEPAPFLKLIKR